MFVFSMLTKRKYQNDLNAPTKRIFIVLYEHLGHGWVLTFLAINANKALFIACMCKIILLPGYPGCWQWLYLISTIFVFQCNLTQMRTTLMNAMLYWDKNNKANFVSKFQNVVCHERACLSSHQCIKLSMYLWLCRVPHWKLWTM